METPKLDELAKSIKDIGHYGDIAMAISIGKVDRIIMIENALLEIREILKTVRQRST